MSRIVSYFFGLPCVWFKLFKAGLTLEQLSWWLSLSTSEDHFVNRLLLEAEQNNILQRTFDVSVQPLRARAAPLFVNLYPHRMNVDNLYALSPSTRKTSAAKGAEGSPWYAATAEHGRSQHSQVPRIYYSLKKNFPIASLAGLTSINWLGRKKKFTLWAKIPKQLLGARGPPKLRKTDSQHCYPEWASLICAWSPVLGY